MRLLILARGIGGRLDLPVPQSYFVVGAASVVVLSFVALAVLWPTPRLQEGPRFSGEGRVPIGVVLAVVGLLSLLLVIGQILPLLFGVEAAFGRQSIAPVLVWVAIWLVVPFGAALFGNWYTFLNPWRSLARAIGIGRGERLDLVDRLGV